MNKIQSSKTNRYFEPTFYLIFCAVFAFLLWKCRYGMACFDEPFYLAVPYRLYLGDALFVHEWHLSQMTSVLLYPFVSVFLSVTGSADGIVLAFRYLFTVVQAAAGLFFYHRLRPIHRLGAAVAALGFMIHAPFGVMALSYNSLGILNLSMAVVIFFTAKTYKPFQYVLAGLFLAGAVLCCPYLLLVYLYLTVVSGFLWLRRKETECLKSWLWVTLGAAMAAIGFAAFTLSRVPLSRILAAFPEMFHDPEHEGRSFLTVVVTYFYYLARGTGIVSLLVGAAGVVAFWFARRDRAHAPRYFAIGAALTVAFAVPFATYRSYPNYLMYPMTVFSLYCLGLTEDGRCREIFWKIVVPGLIYTFCIHWSSNQHFMVMTAAMTVCFLGSTLIVALTAQKLLQAYPPETVGKTNLVAAALSILMVFQICAEVAVRYKTVFWEAPMSQLTYRVEEGPERGLLVSTEPGTYYDRYSAIIESDARYQQAESVLFMTMDTWMYLLEPKQISAYSAWLSGVNDSTAERLNAYYRLNPEKLPDFVFVFQDNLAYAEAVFASRGYESEQIEDYVIFTKPAN